MHISEICRWRWVVVKNRPYMPSDSTSPLEGSRIPQVQCHSFFETSLLLYTAMRCRSELGLRTVFSLRQRCTAARNRIYPSSIELSIHMSWIIRNALCETRALMCSNAVTSKMPIIATIKTDVLAPLCPRQSLQRSKCVAHCLICWFLLTKALEKRLNHSRRLTIAYTSA